MDPLSLMLLTTIRLGEARSALPNAPVVPPAEPVVRLARTRAATAAVLTRLAARVAPVAPPSRTHLDLVTGCNA